MSTFSPLIQSRLSKDYAYLSVPNDTDSRTYPNLQAIPKTVATFTQRDVEALLKNLVEHGLDNDNSVVLPAKTWAELINKES